MSSIRSRAVTGVTVAGAAGPAGPGRAYRPPVDLLRHLRHFVVVAHELHFGRAADVLGIAQPPLSQSIQRLERDLGVELFDRSKRQIRLTTAGQVLLAEADSLLAGQERLRNLMRQVRDGTLGTLHAGVPPETPAVTLRSLLSRLAERAPGLEVDLHELTSAEQLRMLAEARLDVGLVHHPVTGDDDLRYGRVVSVPLGVVLPRDSPLVRSAEIDLADLAGLDLIVPPPASAPGWHDHILTVCWERRYVPERVRHAGNPEFLFGLVLGGRSVAFEQEALARREPRLAWRPISGQPLVKRTSAAWPTRSAHPAAPMFAEAAATVLAESVAPLAGGGPAAMLGPDPAPRPWLMLYGSEHAPRDYLAEPAPPR
jgi:DNA-binding transcriptional LysR family regulator